MLNLLRAILEKWACKHDWDTFAKTKVYDEGDTMDTAYPIRTRYTLICKRCGKIKKVAV